MKPQRDRQHRRRVLRVRRRPLPGGRQRDRDRRRARGGGRRRRHPGHPAPSRPAGAGGCRSRVADGAGPRARHRLVARRSRLGPQPVGRGSGRVVVVPSRSLAGMPWSLMPSLRAAPSPWRHRPPGGPRARRAGGARAASRSPRSTAPAWPAPPRRSGPSSRRGRSPPPPASRSATSEAVVAALGSARIVHLAAHGTHEGQSPLFSSVRMADCPVFAHEFPRPVVAEHVVLSACDVGQFSTRPGDEPLGLAIALFSLGRPASSRPWLRSPTMSPTTRWSPTTGSWWAGPTPPRPGQRVVDGRARRGCLLPLRLGLGRPPRLRRLDLGARAAPGSSRPGAPLR